jgi:amino acid adenylation domain-containing protein
MMEADRDGATPMSDNLARPLCRNSADGPRRLALSVAGSEIGYGDLARFGRSIAGWLLAAGGGKAGRVGVLAGRSVAAYAGVVGACWAGATYVPLGLSWPEQRLLVTLGLTRLDALIVDEQAARLLSPLLLAACPKAILLADPAAVGLDGARFQALNALADRPALAPVLLPDEHIAYIIFTSGTTGSPKGVRISLGAIVHHLAVIQEVYRFTPEDRISLAADLTFDPSILNMFMTWNAGASLHVVPSQELFAPIPFIQDHALTVWNSAPTTIGMLMRLGAFQPDILPGLRVSIFGGETLTVEAAAAWQRAAPASTVDNVYGPTEATIECLHQRLTDPPVVTGERASLALGLPYPGNAVAIVDAALNFLPAGEAGELAVSGSQLAAGYLDQPELTAARFPVIGGTRWYLTGDKAYQDSDGRVHSLGRCDDQIKVRGYRVELGDVESHLRQVCGSELAAAVAWPFANGGAIGIVGFVAGPAGAPLPSPREIRAALERRLPGYMVPQTIRRIASLPMTPHGKVDRRALVALLAAEEA